MKSRTNGTLALLALAAIGALILVLVRSCAIEAVYPMENAGCRFFSRVWPFLRGCVRGTMAEAENVRLKREVASLVMVSGDLERLEAENARLRRALDYRAKRPEAWLAAGVLSQGGGAAGAPNTLRVDKGSLSGVTAGAVVAVPEGLVGRVTSVTPHTAVVTLITDPSVRVACEVEECDRAPMRGVLCGGSERLLVLRYLSNVREVPSRSRVLTSGRGGVFPKGLEVGTLQEVCKDEKDLASRGEVLPEVDFSTLEDVFIRREK